MLSEGTDQVAKPIISILIDTYNHERYIEQAVVSALEQDIPASEYEILVVDDGSTDRTPDIVKKFARRVRLLSKKNGGQASAFNAAFPELRGEIIAFLDGDDWFVPGKLSAVMTALEQHPEAVSVGHGRYERYEETGDICARVPGQSMLLDLKSPEVAGRLFFGLLGWVITSALTVRRNAVERVMPIPNRLRFCADNPIAVSALAGGAYILDRPLCYYRQHSENLCAGADQSAIKARQRYEIYKVIFDVLKPLLPRLGVPSESATALLSSWTEVSRSYLKEFGGSRTESFRTEMGAARETVGASFQYRLFKYFVVGGATLLLPPRQFYRVRDWYARRNLGAVREQFARGR
jgi:glycosyltransferase involved in cell wall biosynthesis